MSSRLSARYLVLTLAAIHALWPALPCGSDFGDNAFGWYCHWDEHRAEARDLFDRAWSPAEGSNRLTVSIRSTVNGDG